VSTGNFYLWEMFDPVHQELLFLLQNNGGCWSNICVQDISFEAFFLSFFKLWFFFFYWVIILIVFDNLFQENMLAIFVCSWESIKDITSISAVIFSKSFLEQLVKELVWYSHSQGVSVDLRRVFNTVFSILSLNCFDLSCDILIDLGFDGCTKLVLLLLFRDVCHLHGYVNHLLDVNPW
jgi:hypothetical protein